MRNFRGKYLGKLKREEIYLLNTGFQRVENYKTSEGNILLLV